MPHPELDSVALIVTHLSSAFDITNDSAGQYQPRLDAWLSEARDILRALLDLTREMDADEEASAHRQLQRFLAEQMDLALHHDEAWRSRIEQWAGEMDEAALLGEAHAIVNEAERSAWGLL